MPRTACLLYLCVNRVFFHLNLNLSLDETCRSSCVESRTSGAEKGRDRMSSVSNLHLSGVDPALKIIIFVLMVAHVAALVSA